MPGGELPVADGDAIIPVINRLLRRFDHAFATQDWHPAEPCLIRQRPSGQTAVRHDRNGLWQPGAMARPRHRRYTEPPPSIRPIDQTRIEAVIRKGFRPALDSYSAFFENDRQTPTGLEAWLRQRGFSRLFLCGLATDFCVAWSAEDAARLGFAVIIIEDACRGIGLAAPGGGPRSTPRATDWRAWGCAFVDSRRHLASSMLPDSSAIPCCLLLSRSNQLRADRP